MAHQALAQTICGGLALYFALRAESGVTNGEVRPCCGAEKHLFSKFEHFFNAGVPNSEFGFVRFRVTTVAPALFM
jgi:hypothetical protein